MIRNDSTEEKFSVNFPLLPSGPIGGTQSSPKPLRVSLGSFMEAITIRSIGQTFRVPIAQYEPGKELSLQVK